MALEQYLKALRRASTPESDGGSGLLHSLYVLQSCTPPLPLATNSKEETQPQKRKGRTRSLVNSVAQRGQAYFAAAPLDEQDTSSSDGRSLTSFHKRLFWMATSLTAAGGGGRGPEARAVVEEVLSQFHEYLHPFATDMILRIATEETPDPDTTIECGAEDTFCQVLAIVVLLLVLDRNTEFFQRYHGVLQALQEVATGNDFLEASETDPLLCSSTDGQLLLFLLSRCTDTGTAIDVLLRTAAVDADSGASTRKFFRRKDDAVLREWLLAEASRKGAVVLDSTDPKETQQRQRVQEGHREKDDENSKAYTAIAAIQLIEDSIEQCERSMRRHPQDTELVAQLVELYLASIEVSQQFVLHSQQTRISTTNTNGGNATPYRADQPNAVPIPGREPLDIHLLLERAYKGLAFLSRVEQEEAQFVVSPLQPLTPTAEETNTAASSEQQPPENEEEASPLSPVPTTGTPNPKKDYPKRIAFHRFIWEALFQEEDVPTSTKHFSTLIHLLKKHSMKQLSREGGAIEVVSVFLHRGELLLGGHKEPLPCVMRGGGYNHAEEAVGMYRAALEASSPQDTPELKRLAMKAHLFIASIAFDVARRTGNRKTRLDGLQGALNAAYKAKALSQMLNREQYLLCSMILAEGLLRVGQLRKAGFMLSLVTEEDLHDTSTQTSGDIVDFFHVLQCRCAPDDQEAERHCRETAANAPAHSRLKGEALCSLALIDDTHDKDDTRSLEALSQALPVFIGLEDHWREAEVYGEMAELYEGLGQLSSGLNFAQHKHTIATECNFEVLQYTALVQCGRILVSMNRGTEALDVWGKVHRQSHEFGDTEVECTTSKSLISLQEEQHSFTEVLRTCRLLIALAEKLSAPNELVFALHHMAAAHLKLGHYQRTVSTLEDLDKVLENVGESIDTGIHRNIQRVRAQALSALRDESAAVAVMVDLYESAVRRRDWKEACRAAYSLSEVDGAGCVDDKALDYCAKTLCAARALLLETTNITSGGKSANPNAALLMPTANSDSFKEAFSAAARLATANASADIWLSLWFSEAAQCALHRGFGFASALSSLFPVSSCTAPAGGMVQHTPGDQENLSEEPNTSFHRVTPPPQPLPSPLERLVKPTLDSLPLTAVDPRITVLQYMRVGSLGAGGPSSGSRTEKKVVFRIVLRPAGYGSIVEVFHTYPIAVESLTLRRAVVRNAAANGAAGDASAGTNGAQPQQQALAVAQDEADFVMQQRYLYDVLLDPVHKYLERAIAGYTRTHSHTPGGTAGNRQNSSQGHLTSDKGENLTTPSKEHPQNCRHGEQTPPGDADQNPQKEEAIVEESTGRSSVPAEIVESAPQGCNVDSMAVGSHRLLAVVADPLLSGIPFGALCSPQRQSLWQQTPVVMCTSLTQLLLHQSSSLSPTSLLGVAEPKSPCTNSSQHFPRRESSNMIQQHQLMVPSLKGITRKEFLATMSNPPSAVAIFCQPSPMFAVMASVPSSSTASSSGETKPPSRPHSTGGISSNTGGGAAARSTGGGGDRTSRSSAVDENSTCTIFLAENGSVSLEEAAAAVANPSAATAPSGGSGSPTRRELLIAPQQPSFLPPQADLQGIGMGLVGEALQVYGWERIVRIDTPWMSQHHEVLCAMFTEYLHDAFVEVPSREKEEGAQVLSPLPPFALVATALQAAIVDAQHQRKIPASVWGAFSLWGAP